MKDVKRYIQFSDGRGEGERGGTGEGGGCVGAVGGGMCAGVASLVIIIITGVVIITIIIVIVITVIMGCGGTPGNRKHMPASHYLHYFHIIIQYDMTIISTIIFRGCESSWDMGGT